MGKRAQSARDLYMQGHSCSQAVLLAFEDEIGIDRDTALKLASSFSGGMGGMKEVCGSLSGMFMVAGIKYGYTHPQTPQQKEAHNKLIQELTAEFKSKHGNMITCRDLTAKAGDLASRKAACAQIVSDAAEIMENYIAAH